MLANNDLEPGITIEEKRGGGFRVEMDVRPFDPAPMIGSGGTMKLAIQTMLVGSMHPNTIELVFLTPPRGLMSPRLRNITPAVEPMKSVFDAAVNHWRKIPGVRTAEAQVETSATTAIAILTLDETLSLSQRGAVSRVVRAIGKANGYRGACVIEKPAMA